MKTRFAFKVRIVAATSKARGAIVTASEPLNNRSSGRWRRYAKQLEPVLPVLLPWAERLGYRE